MGWDELFQELCRLFIANNYLDIRPGSPADGIEPGGMDYLDGYYTLYSDLWEYCPEMGHEVRFPMGIMPWSLLKTAMRQQGLIFP